MQEKLTTLFRVIIAYGVMGLSGAIGLALRLLSFGLLTEFNRRIFIPASSRLILRLGGVRLRLPEKGAYPPVQAVYTFNHNSFFDVFILTALGMGNTRILLSEKTRRILPLTLSALALGIWYIPEKKNKERRLRFFEQTADKIRREGCSLLASSEGVHTFLHGIAPFNKGIYHLAMACNLPVVPLYIHIPKETNCLQGFVYKKGKVYVEIMPTIDTTSWTQDSLRTCVEDVRKMYLNKFTEAHGAVSIE